MVLGNARRVTTGLIMLANGMTALKLMSKMSGKKVLKSLSFFENVVKRLNWAFDSSSAFRLKCCFFPLE